MMIMFTKPSSTIYGQPPHETSQNLNNYGKGIKKTKLKFTYSSVQSSQVCLKVLLAWYQIITKILFRSGGKIIHSNLKDFSLLSGFISRISIISILIICIIFKVNKSPSLRIVIFLMLRLQIKCSKFIKNVP